MHTHAHARKALADHGIQEVSRPQRVRSPAPRHQLVFPLGQPQLIMHAHCTAAATPPHAGHATTHHAQPQLHNTQRHARPVRRTRGRDSEHSARRAPFLRRALPPGAAQDSPATAWLLPGGGPPNNSRGQQHGGYRVSPPHVTRAGGALRAGAHCVCAAPSACMHARMHGLAPPSSTPETTAAQRVLLHAQRPRRPATATAWAPPRMATTASA